MQHFTGLSIILHVHVAVKTGYCFHLVFEWQRGQRVENSAGAGWLEGRGEADGRPTGRECGLWPPTDGMGEQCHVIDM